MNHYTSPEEIAQMVTYSLHNRGRYRGECPEKDFPVFNSAVERGVRRYKDDFVESGLGIHCTRTSDNGWIIEVYEEQHD